eukprot:TRINITY_DN385_c2_g2_i1.p1 TRINITY_DN385_c2_g2~~TRINITY_DN385_c2_g2_i1.p1  ORF type:complete len:395 (-),score=119.82 TRINITY_DN385_c2_g2_i1:67-1251(-)
MNFNFKILTLFLFILLSLHHIKSDVVRLNDDNFDNHIKDGVWLVKFYAPWCKYCREIVATYVNLAEVVQDNWNIGEVDCIENEFTCDEKANNMVNSYPTIILFKDGKYIRMFPFERTVEKMIEFVEKNVPDVPKTEYIPSTPPDENENENEIEEVIIEDSQVIVLTDESFEETTKEGAWFIEFYAPWCNHCKSLTPVWEELAHVSSEKDINIAKVDITKNTVLKERFKVVSMPSIILYIDGGVIIYTGTRKLDNFVEFIDYELKHYEEKSKDTSVEKEKRVSVLHIGNFDDQIKDQDYFVMFYAPWCKYSKLAKPHIERVAKKTPFNIGKVDCTVEGQLKHRFDITRYPQMFLFKKDGTFTPYYGTKEYKPIKQYLRENIVQEVSEEIEPEIII